MQLIADAPLHASHCPMFGSPIDRHCGDGIALIVPLDVERATVIAKAHPHALPPARIFLAPHHSATPSSGLLPSPARRSRTEHECTVDDAST